MPFVEMQGAAGVRGGVADGLTHDIITRLAKLRNLFVIARGSVFALAEQNIAPGGCRPPAERRLSSPAAPCAARAGRIIVTVELVEVRTARIVWAEAFDRRPDDTFAVLDDIGNSIVASISTEIETVERNRAMLKAPNSLNAWEAYHRGLWHMYRFTAAGERAGPAFLRDAPASSIRPSPAPMPACPSPIGRMPFSAGAIATGKRPGLRGGRPEPARRRSQSGRALGHGPGACGCAATRRRIARSN